MQPDAPANPLLILLPVYNDWAAAEMLLAQLDEELTKSDARADVLLADDGSTEPRRWPETKYHAIGRISVLRLARNLGHQRALAVALAHIAANFSYDAVVVMDADGEDRPADALALHTGHQQSETPRMIFGQRAERSEGAWFSFWYRLYLLAFRALTGQHLQSGNLSLIPGSMLCAVVTLPELWNHYASALLNSRLPFMTLPCPRGKRLAGRSNMNFVGLMTHGLSAISVFAEAVGARLIAASLFIAAAAFAATIIVTVIRVATNWAIPGWATYTFGLGVVVLLQAVTMAFVLSLLVLNRRSHIGFLPQRDYAYFVRDVETIYQQ
jgi:hypothetical protein